MDKKSKTIKEEEKEVVKEVKASSGEKLTNEEIKTLKRVAKFADKMNEPFTKTVFSILLAIIAIINCYEVGIIIGKFLADLGL